MTKLPLRKTIGALKCALINTVTRKHKYPFYASFKLTRRCMLKCPFCDVWKEGGDRELHTPEVFRVLDNLASSSIVAVSFEGGEPLLRDDIEDILEYVVDKPLFTELTTSFKDVDIDRVIKCSKYLDYLHVSIDEGHKNLYLLDELQELKRCIDTLVIQVVVGKKDIHALEEKMEKINKAGIKVVVMPAVYVNGTQCEYPDPQEFRHEILRLKQIYNGSIITTDGYLNAINQKHGCDTASIIIDADGSLYYPCHMLKIKAINAVTQNLKEFLSTPKAKALRSKGHQCTKSCGWYQYFATSSYYKPTTCCSTLRPYVHDIIYSNKKAKP